MVPSHLVRGKGQLVCRMSWSAGMGATPDLSGPYPDSMAQRVDPTRVWSVWSEAAAALGGTVERLRGRLRLEAVVGRYPVQARAETDRIAYEVGLPGKLTIDPNADGSRAWLEPVRNRDPGWEEWSLRVTRKSVSGTGRPEQTAADLEQAIRAWIEAADRLVQSQCKA